MTCCVVAKLHKANWILWCASSQGNTTTSKMSWNYGAQRKLSHNFRMGVTLLVLLASTSILYDGPSFFSSVPAQAAEPKSECVVDREHGTTNCRCDETEKTPQTLAATLSEDQNVLKVSCKNNELHCAPDQLNGDKVCPGDATKVHECTSSSGSNECIKLSDILVDPGKSVTWARDTTESSNECTTKQLTVPKQNFPYTDKKFVVGCVQKSGNTDQCTVTVTVAARASAKNGQTVTCAYGTSSNKEPQTITLSPSQNAFTLVCGTDGEIMPSTYQQHYCDSSENGTTGDCQERDYTSILTAYQDTWWQKTENSSYTLQIPPTDFPEEPANIMVGCKKTKVSKRGQTSEGEPSTVCKVLVTIEASPNSSSATMSGMKAYLAVGAVAIISAFVHAM
ncbi:SRS domain-containing protein [Neospora caninum Liverpool]|uniref:SRS domain-containing protein n=1 Tax=Neospora caninum (strain Liverpool) TaxID=572307 RepID=F0VKD3_NEOCL|nr:SRS domain-containing protein [Neospora caninum Liverpool]CBZ54534.1 SRS domain-containing protein [Neospora caninum Liverpool]CEL69247.1 TPA: SRS domain-containing protein [Neospora caninum Liverpool]|eukprot:XP_003884564.1 SRS domain-containing protein [Neospora caninum Liverpool]